MRLAKDARGFLVMVGERGALLGVDPGTETIGIAVCDERRTLASPLETIARSRLAADLDRMAILVRQRGAVGVVLGMPYNMDGSSGRRAQSVRAFSRSIEEAMALPVLHWDERLSTVAAEEAMMETDRDRAARARRIDAVAAASILQGALGVFTGIAAQERLSE